MIRIASASHYFQPLTDNAPPPSLDTALQELCRENFRRIDRFIQLALLGSARCVTAQDLRGDCAIYLGSGLGPIGNNIVTQQQLIRDCELPKPFNFINTLGSSAGYYVARNLGLSGQSFFLSRRSRNLEAVLNAAMVDLQSGVVIQALLGIVEEASVPFSEHRRRQGLPEQTAVAEGSHWLLLQAGGNTGHTLERHYFAGFDGLMECLQAEWRSGDSLRCSPDVAADSADELYAALPDCAVPDSPPAFHDSMSAVWLTGNLTAGGAANLFLVSGDSARGWTLFHSHA